VELSCPLHEFLASGDVAEPESVAKGLASKWGLALSLPLGERRELWLAHREAVLDDWREEHPGTRLWAWWAWDASEPRRVVTGAELLLPVRAPGDWAWVWRENFGVPAFRQVRSPSTRDPAVESQATYLDRLGELSAEERAALPADAFKPQTIAIPTKEWRPGACAGSTSATRQ
jgi:hypothetical protein